MPFTSDPQEDKSREARQKRYERHVAAVDHVEDDAFQDKWREVRGERAEVTLEINHINREKGPLMANSRRRRTRRP